MSFRNSLGLCRPSNRGRADHQDNISKMFGWMRAMHCTVIYYHSAQSLGVRLRSVRTVDAKQGSSHVTPGCRSRQLNRENLLKHDAWWLTTEKQMAVCNSIVFSINSLIIRLAP
jgi:hypothetical protein